MNFRTSPIASRAELENIIRRIVLDFEQGRLGWFASLLILLKERESRFRSNPQLAGEAELATIVIQCADALEFIAKRGYIPPESGRAFATLLFVELVQGKDVRMAQELYQLHLAAQGKNEEGELMYLCGLVAECIFDADNSSASDKSKVSAGLSDNTFACLRIGGTIPKFTLFNYCDVARAFNDLETLRELEKRT